MAKVRGHLGVVILGAGDSVRMGRPKLLLPWGGTTVVGSLISQWRELGAGQIAIVHRVNDLVLATELDRLNFPKPDRIENCHPERGMFSSIAYAVNWSGWREELSHWAIMLGDQPHLRPETLRQLLDCSAQNREAICRPVSGGRPGHPVILPRASWLELRNSGAATLKDFLKRATAPTVDCVVVDAGVSLDMDTPEDYKRLQVSFEP